MRIPLEALWDAVTDFSYINPEIAGWCDDGESFYISQYPEDRQLLVDQYVQYARRLRTRIAKTWRSVSKLINTYADDDEDYINRRSVYKIKYFWRANRNDLNFCCMKPKYMRSNNLNKPPPSRKTLQN
jgi:hypothetical protein